MFTRPSLQAIRLRLSNQIRWRSEPSSSNGYRQRRSFTETVITGHSKALEEMECEIVEREEKRRKELESSENILLRRIIPVLQKEVLNNNSQFVPVGSSVNGLASSHSDLDVVLLPNGNIRDQFIDAFHSNDGLKAEFMSVLRSSLVHSLHSLADPRFEVEDCHIFPSIKVPLLICKFANGSSLDITLPDNTFQSIRNSHLMALYAQCDPRLSRLLLWLRAWSSSLGIRDSKSGLLSSYHLLMLAIHFLQSEQSLGKSPVLPILYQTHRKLVDKSVPIDNIVENLNEMANGGKMKNDMKWTSPNKMSTAELIVRFIDYYADVDLLKTEIHIDKGVAMRQMSKRIRFVDRGLIFDPYSFKSVCNSAIALQSFKDAVSFTRRRMFNGFMFNPFTPSADTSYNNFIESTMHEPWSQSAMKRKAKIRKSGFEC